LKFANQAETEKVKKRWPHFMTLTIVSVIVSSSALFPRAALSESNRDEQAVENTYKAYVQAWKTKDIAALQDLISDDYMAVNFENRVSSKKIEIATAKNDAAWDAMKVDEIHARVFGASAIASGFISAQGKKTDGAPFSAKVRFLAVLVKQNGQWQLAATQSSAVKVPQHSPN
jgi:uncharacterized protein (TIGR02246 family)